MFLASLHRCRPSNDAPLSLKRTDHHTAVSVPHPSENPAYAAKTVRRCRSTTAYYVHPSGRCQSHEVAALPGNAGLPSALRSATGARHVVPALLKTPKAPGALCRFTDQKRPAARRFAQPSLPTSASNRSAGRTTHHDAPRVAKLDQSHSQVIHRPPTQKLTADSVGSRGKDSRVGRLRSSPQPSGRQVLQASDDFP